MSRPNGHSGSEITDGYGRSPHTAIESWIHHHADVEFVASPRFRYDGMSFQAPTDLAGVYRPHDPARISDWGSLALVYSFVHALETHGRILDIGSGDGWPALPLAPYLQQVVGIDPSPRRTDVANENLHRFGYDHVQFRTASGEALPFHDRYFDGVVAGTAIEQSDDRDAVLAEVFRVLRPGGRFVATFENVLAGRQADDPPTERAALVASDNGDILYGYCVVSMQTLLETEYRVLFRGEKLSASLDSDTLHLERQPEPESIRLHEIGGRDPDTVSRLGIPALDAVLALPALQSVTAEACRIRHFSAETVTRSLADAGFSEVTVRGRVSKAASTVAEDLAARGVLAELADRFHPICASLAKQWPMIAAEQDQALFVVARRPVGRSGEQHTLRRLVGRSRSQG